MPYSDRELLARLIACEAGGEGDNGMRAMASVVGNRARVPYGEFFRVSRGGNIRAVMEQARQFTCMMTSVGGAYNAQNVYNMDPTDFQYEVADWVLQGGSFGAVANSLFYYNPFSPTCAGLFPPGGAGSFLTRIRSHCFYIPTEKYAQS